MIIFSRITIFWCCLHSEFQNFPIVLKSNRIHFRIPFPHLLVNMTLLSTSVYLPILHISCKWNETCYSLLLLFHLVCLHASFKETSLMAEWDSLNGYAVFYLSSHQRWTSGLFQLFGYYEYWYYKALYTNLYNSTTLKLSQDREN